MFFKNIFQFLIMFIIVSLYLIILSYPTVINFFFDMGFESSVLFLTFFLVIIT